MATEVEEVLTIESGSGLVDVTVTSIANENGTKVARIRKQLNDTSFLVFTERELLVATGPNQRRIALIKLGPDVYYPLEKGRTIVYRIDADRYLFPATASTAPDQYLIIKFSTDASSQHVRRQIDELLNYYATLVVEVPGASEELDVIKRFLGITVSTDPTQGLYPNLADLPRPTSPQAAAGTLPEPSAHAKTIAQGIVTGAEYLASGLNIGTKITEELVHKGGANFVDAENRTEVKPVDPKVIAALKTVRMGADCAANVSTTVVSAVASGTRRLSERLVPHIHRHGTKLVSDVTGRDQESSSQTMNDILSVTASGLHAFGTLYNCVTENAKTLGKAVASETVNYVSKRYGNDAGQAAHEALYAAGSGYVAATAVSDLAPKAMVKKAAKEAGKTVISNYGQRREDQSGSNSPPSSSNSL